MMEKASAMIEAKMIARVRNENTAKVIDTRAVRLGKFRISAFLKFIWTLKMFIKEISRKKKLA